MQRFQRRFRHRCDSDGVAECVEHFDGIAVFTIRRRMIVDNFYDVTTAQAVFWNVASKSCISVEIEAHNELFFWNQGNEFRDTRQILFHPYGADMQGHAVWSKERATNFVRLTKLCRRKRRGIEREQLCA